MVLINNSSDILNIILYLSDLYKVEIIKFVFKGLIIFVKEFKIFKNLLKKFFVFGFVILKVSILKVS